MKQEELFEIIGEVDGTFIKEASEPVPKRNKINPVKWVAAAACICLVISAAIFAQPDRYGEIAMQDSSENVAARYITEEYLAEAWQPLPATGACFYVTEGKVAMTLSRLRKQLKKYLEEEGVTI